MLFRSTEGSSWTATEVEDIVWLGSSDVAESLELYMPEYAVAYPFGCQTNSKGLFRKQYADGILGLSIHETSIVNYLYKEALIPRNAFSLCFTREGGYLSLGGTLPKADYHYQPMQMTPLTREHGYYSVEVVRLSLYGDTIVAAPGKYGNNVRRRTSDIDNLRLLRDMHAGKGCIFDSGTTDSYFPESLAKIVQKTVMEYTNGGCDFTSSKTRRRVYSYEEFLQLPTITIGFANDATIDVKAQNYMENVPIDPSTGGVIPWKGTIPLTNRIYFEEADGVVLGANAMLGYDIMFDVQDRQVGVAPANCHLSANAASGLDADAL